MNEDAEKGGWRRGRDSRVPVRSAALDRVVARSAKFFDAWEEPRATA